MIHYSCDRCGRPIDSTNELRYVVTLDIRAKMDGLGPSHQEEDDQDLLQTLEEVLETSDSQESDLIADDVDQQMRFDMCASCYRRFRKNPLAAERPASVTFSKN